MIKRSSRPLIVLPEAAGVDHYASAFGLKEALKKMDKDAVIATIATIPKAMQALKGEHLVYNDIPGLHELTIELPLDVADEHSIRHSVNEGKLQIHVAPKSGVWKEHHVQVRPGNYRYDVLICIGSSDLPGCGRLFQDYADFFYRTPIINIDHAAANEHYGAINAIDVTAASCGEVCHDVVSSIDPSLVDASIATHFLTGMIAKTKSFKTRNVTPKTLAAASTLVGLGGKREEIIHHLYRTRSVATLRLWGRALARLKADPEQKFVWTLLSAQDFLHAGAQEVDLPEVIDELIASSPEAERVLILYENSDHHICGILRTTPPTSALKLLGAFDPVGTTDEARICLTTMNLIEAEQKILTTMPK